MFARATRDEDEVDAAAFANFNEKLFMDPDAPVETFAPLQSPPTHHITPEELAETLAGHFRANRSPGLSPMPL